jgi:predicted nucleotidyltransferase
MRILGIVSEYNPFHRGHSYHMEASRKLLGGDCGVVCVMGGNFMQRGEAAVFSKHARAEAAVRCGADVVFELPLPWAVASAERFAHGAVGLLNALGAVTHISFGSECGEIAPLNALATALIDPSLDRKIKLELEKGLPYAAARQNALEQDVGELARLLEKPNNILAVEYLKALYELRSPIEPLTVRRSGAGHDERSSGALRSAAELRSMLAAGENISAQVPPAAAAVYLREIEQGRGPVGENELETAVLSRLRMLKEADYEALPDATEGLGSRLYRAAVTEPTLDAVMSAAKTKRYAMARLRRMSMCAALGVKAGMADGVPPYARLLAASERGRDILREIGEKTRIPTITKPAAVREMNRDIRALFDLECSATDLYALGFTAREERRGGREWRTSPLLVK